MNKIKLSLWGLYDFANSMVFVTFLVYFSRWLVADGGVSDLSYNLIYVISAIALLFTAPALAAHVDVSGNRIRHLRNATIGTILCYLFAALGAIHNASIIFTYLAFLGGQYFYNLAFTFYDPLINDLSDTKHRARASGIGQFCNSAGMITGLLLSMFLVSFGRLAPLIPSIILFAILSAPMLIFYRESPHKTKMQKIKLGFDWKKFRGFILGSAATPILIAFFFYTDALNAITNNYSIYANAVLQIPDNITAFLLLVVQVFAAIGALIISRVGDRFGPRKCLFVILFTWLALIPVLSLTASQNLFYVLIGVLGLTIGAGWAISRAYISQNLESKNMNYGFSFYTMFERFSTIMGALVWSGVIAIVGNSVFGYRAAMLSMTIFIIVGILTLMLGKANKTS